MTSFDTGWNRLAKTYDPIRCGNIDGTTKDIHDKAILRAVKSTYRPNKGVTGDENCTLFVGRLSLKTEEATLREIFEKYGGINKLKVVRDLVTGYSKGYAFINYETNSQVNLAHIHTNGIMIDGSKIIVEFEHERAMPGWIPRRLGGGFGGKKEAGQLRFGGRDRPFKKPLIEHHKQSSSSDYRERRQHRESRIDEKHGFREQRNHDRHFSRERPRPYDRHSRNDGRR